MRNFSLCRIAVFAGGPKGVAWFDWSKAPLPKGVEGRRPCDGTFYRHTPRDAWRRARVILKADPRVDQVKVETISGREVGRLYRWSEFPRP